MILDLWIFGWLVTSCMLIVSTLDDVSHLKKNPFINGFMSGVGTIFIACLCWPVLLVGVVEFFSDSFDAELESLRKRGERE